MRKTRFLRDISSLKKRDRDIYLKKCGEKYIHIISECALNILNGECGEQCLKNKKIKGLLKQVSEQDFPIQKKRKILVQSGKGIFSVILGVVPFLLNLLKRK